MRIKTHVNNVSADKLVTAETPAGSRMNMIILYLSMNRGLAWVSLIKPNELDITPASLPLYTLLILLELNKVLYPIIIDCGIAPIYLESNF